MCPGAGGLDSERAGLRGDPRSSQRLRPGEWRSATPNRCPAASPPPVPLGDPQPSEQPCRRDPHRLPVAKAPSHADPCSDPGVPPRRLGRAPLTVSTGTRHRAQAVSVLASAAGLRGQRCPLEFSGAVSVPGPPVSCPGGDRGRRGVGSHLATDSLCAEAGRDPEPVGRVSHPPARCCGSTGAAPGLPVMMSGADGTTVLGMRVALPQAEATAASLARSACARGAG